VHAALKSPCGTEVGSRKVPSERPPRRKAISSTQSSGSTPPSESAERAWLARFDPSYASALRELEARVWRPAQPALALKYRALIAAVILACRGHPTLDRYLRRAIAEGASVRELLEGLETAAILGGFTVLDDALPSLVALCAEDQGDTPDGSNTDGSSSAQLAGGDGSASRTKAVSGGMNEWAYLDAVDPAYDGARRAITAFVWTPRTPALPVKIRELVASAVLAYRAFPTLDAHLRRAVREGASVLEIIEALETAALPGGFPVLHYALPFVAAIEKDLKEGRLR
jgi:alkylhydroperoxidase/carboxymuconolactone decarboxylase family protein YurZ